MMIQFLVADGKNYGMVSPGFAARRMDSSARKRF